MFLHKSAARDRLIFSNPTQSKTTITISQGSNPNENNKKRQPSL